MDITPVNPWTWQDAFGFSQANQVAGASRILVCSGQTSVDADGNVVHAGDMRAQIGQALDNLEAVLRDAGMQLSSVVRLNVYTTNVDAYFEGYEEQATRLAQAGCKPASTLLGVARLAFPDLMVELEATAVA